MISDLYVCCCSCGRKFTSKYPSTPLCRACASRLVGGSGFVPDDASAETPDETPVFDPPCGFLEFWTGGLAHEFVRWAKRRNWVLALFIIAAVLFVLVWIASMSQADMQGWDK